MKWSVGTKIGTGFGLALVLLGIVGAISYVGTSALMQTAGWVSHTNQVRFVLADLIYLVDEAETGERGYIITGDENYLQPYTSAIQRIPARMRELRTLTADNPNQQGRLDTLDPLISKDLSALGDIIDIRRNKGFEAARLAVLENRREAFLDNFRQLHEAMGSEEAELLKVRDVEARTTVRNVHLAIVLGTLTAIALLSLAGFFIARSITVPLNEVSATAERIAMGNLMVTMTSTERGDEVGKLVQSFNRMSRSLQGMAQAADRIANRDLRVEVKPQSENDILGNALVAMVKNLRDTMREIREGTSVLAASASEILAATTQVAAGSAETATAVSQTTATVEEVKQTGQVSSEKARQVSDGAQRSAQASQAGRKAVNESIEGMNHIRKQVDSIAESIVRLSERG
jgi:CHASE3 domain sensor protein